MRNVNFDVQDGEVLGLLGRNGSGKTTLIRAIAGLIPHQDQTKGGLGFWGDESRRLTGSILLDGGHITNLPPGQRNIGLVPQNLLLYPSKTVVENLEFPLVSQGLSKREARAKALRVAERLGVSEVVDRLPGQISGGQQQRVALGRALIREPSVILLDEPFSSLDTMAKTEFLSLVGSMLTQSSACAVFVTHDPGEASVLCDRVALLEDSDVVGPSRPTDFYRNPPTLFVAKFFSGFENVIHGFLDKWGSFRPDSGEGSWELKDFKDYSRWYGKEGKFVVAARPTALTLSRGESRSGIIGVFRGQYSSVGQWFGRVEIGPEVLVSCTLSEVARFGARVSVELAEGYHENLALFRQR